MAETTSPEQLYEVRVTIQTNQGLLTQTRSGVPKGAADAMIERERQEAARLGWTVISEYVLDAPLPDAGEMRLIIRPTDRVVEVAARGPIPGRIWEGKDEHGADVILLVTRVALHNDDPAAQERFAARLQEQKAPASARAAGAFFSRYFIG